MSGIPSAHTGTGSPPVVWSVRGPMPSGWVGHTPAASVAFVATTDAGADPLPRLLEIETRHGPARAHVHAALGSAQETQGCLVLGHGAGGGVGAPDLQAVTTAATAAGFVVVLLEQPYRTAGRRGAPRAPVLDSAWTDALDDLRRTQTRSLPLIVGGRSAGARVACRTAAATGADAVVCLAFPTRPPGRPDAPSRLPELDAVEVPVLVVQGSRDPYGVPPAAPGRTVVTVAGDHSLRADLPSVVAAVLPWLRSHGSRPGAGD